MSEARASVVPSSPSHIDTILRDGLRESDVVELEGLGSDPELALTAGLAHAPLCWTILADGHPVGMFGVALVGNDVGIAWMLATEGLSLITRDFVRQMHAWVNHMQAFAPVLTNVIHEGQGRSIAWLRRLGFEFSPCPDLPGYLRFTRCATPSPSP